jgi:hypothetical protein
MAEEKNLLLRRPFLTPEHCKKIEFAWAHAPSRYVTNHIGGRPAVIRELGLLSRKDVMDALREVNRVYGTAVHDTLRTLEMPLRELRARSRRASASSRRKR